MGRGAHSDGQGGHKQRLNLVTVFVLLLLCVGLSSVPLALAYDNGAPNSRTPPMGWSSWVALSPIGEHPIFDYCDESSVMARQSARPTVASLTAVLLPRHGARGSPRPRWG